MKLQFKNQKFQADAARAVVDVFSGQPYLTPTYLIDRGSDRFSGNGESAVQTGLYDDSEFTGFRNQGLVSELGNDQILRNIQKIQRENQIKPSSKLEGQYNLTIEMETGVGKTYTYIKTIYELNKHYGWSKFIIVVPSVAIREGVYKSFEMTQEHFKEEYEKPIDFFIYDSENLAEISNFASSNQIKVMIINSQAFNARGKNARRIRMELDEFRSRRPIDVIAQTNPILIIDEPQSVEGPKTKKSLLEFNPLMTLRYSATHKSDSIYNMVYRLDAMEAYNKKLVKKIAVKGITKSGTTGTNAYLYLEGINLSKKDPTATLQYEVQGKNGPRVVSRIVTEGYNLYPNSGELEEYKNGFTITRIDGRDNSIEFLNGIKLYAGEVYGSVDELQLRRIQIRETILSHIERERQLFHKGIKVLSLFFIDEVAHYRKYDEAGDAKNGEFATIFEEEYEKIISDTSLVGDDPAYRAYLNIISPSSTHEGYFSIDKKGHLIDSEVKKKESTSDDVDAFDLIMKNKELLLDRDPDRSPVRFIFSHSALREGWDNPNVFQICTLKSSSSEIRKRQEVGRGLRLSVNKDGERMDTGKLGRDVHDVNVLTVIASESYDSFAKGLQSEMADAISDRPLKVSQDLFLNKVFHDKEGNEIVVDSKLAGDIYFELVSNHYIDRNGNVTASYYDDKNNGKLVIAEDLQPLQNEIFKIVDSIYDPIHLAPEDARLKNVELKIDEEKLNMKEFQNLWKRINAKTIYVVDFDSNELIQKAIKSLDENLYVSSIFFKVETGEMREIQSKEALKAGTSFVKDENKTIRTAEKVNSSVTYDLVGKLVEETKLTREDIVQILKGIKPETFEKFKYNPEEFILKASRLINDQKATAIIEHITYNVLDDHYGTDLFTEPTIRGRLDYNAMKADKHLYDHIVYDSTNERDFATELDKNTDVAVYVKLPNGFFINTPVGRYNPDWAIAFYEGNVKNIYFVAETKGSMSSMDLRPIEEAKIQSAKEHFKAISSDAVRYEVVESYDKLLAMITK